SVPAGITVTAATSTQGRSEERRAAKESTPPWGPGPLSPDQAMTVTVVATVSSTTRGTLQNEACVHATEADPVPSNNCATDVATVAASANLSLTKPHTPEPVTAGRTITYTIVAASPVPASATSVNLTDSVPAGITVTAATSTQGSCAPVPATG